MTFNKHDVREVSNLAVRYDFVDLLKVLAILLVVIGHFSNDLTTRKFVYSFHIPLFFILSGFLYKKRTEGVEFKRSIISLLLPYFIYGLFIITALYVAHKDTSCLVESFITGNLDIISNPLCPLWFLIVLFNIRLSVSVVGGKMMIFSLLYLLIESVLNMGESDIAQWKSTLACYPFFFIGMLLKRYWSYLVVFFDNYPKRIISSLILLSVYIVCYQLNGDSLVVYMRNSYGNSAFLSYICAICFSGLLILSFMKTKSSRLIRILSDGTLLIFATHSLLAGIVSNINPINNEIIGPLIESFVIVNLYYIPIVFCQRYIPILLGKNINICKK